MRRLAIVGVVMLLGGCAAEATNSEGLPAPPACIRVETGASPQAASNKIWTDDWLAPTAVGPEPCPPPQEGESDETTTRPQSLNAYTPVIKGEKQGPPQP